MYWLRGKLCPSLMNEESQLPEGAEGCVMEHKERALEE